MEHNLDTSGDWIVTNLTMQALAVFARTSPAVRARLTERLHHYQDSPHKSVASRARKLLAESVDAHVIPSPQQAFTRRAAGKTQEIPRTPECPLRALLAVRNPPSKVVHIGGYMRSASAWLSH